MFITQHQACIEKKDTNELFGIYSIVADVPCVVPNKPYIILDQIKEINYWYVMVRKGMTVTYDDFINNISFKKEDYYASHVIALLNDEEIDDLIELYYMLNLDVMCKGKETFYMELFDKFKRKMNC